MTKHYVSIIVSDLEANPSLPRLLQSVARQSTGLERTEVIVAGGDVHSASSESLWSAITGMDNVTLLRVDADATPASARNRAVEESHGSLLAFLRPDYRLDPKYLTTAISVFEDRAEADVMYADYIRLAPKHDKSIRPGMVQLPDFDDGLLHSRNILGPAVMMRRETFDATVGFRDNTVYRDWDLWIQAAGAGAGFLHVDYPLSSCEHAKVSFRERAEDGRCKAMIVINNQSCFHIHTVKWALAYLRGDSWAHAYSFMVIPTAMEVTRMMHEYHMQQMGTDVLTRKAIRQFDLEPHTIQASR
ncbi:glycosyltransferase [Pseudodesulfovibrio cashew]|uniref:Glycosyltransferase n=1 Tax=Pseudodesulfovibrio cashew TaxID=2678688 RepID=A0A6I6JFL6_9BACT|nr:glycosyltransferase [Pseudodesulfovibrio cashew]QGY40961.1 glycosyltransferase [Pseudodesulfovibrio cashew]